MTREEINAAIWKVLRTQFIKNAPEAFKIVKDAGYKVYKCNGSFRVRNDATRREIYVSYRRYGSIDIIYGYYCGMRKNVADLNIIAFDFVGCLNKKYNDEYYDMLRLGDDRRSKAIKNYEGLKSARWSIDYDDRKIKEIKDKIEKLQDELIYYSKAKAKDEIRLNEYRTKIGLN